MQLLGSRSYTVRSRQPWEAWLGFLDRTWAPQHPLGKVRAGAERGSWGW